MIRWVRVVLPSLGYLVLYAILYGSGAAFVLGVEWYYNVRLPEELRHRLTTFVLIIAATCYAVWRAAGFHPLFNPQYSKWLAATPWTSLKPLPLGPVHLVAQDVLILGSAVLAAWFYGDAWALYVPALFLGSYAAILGGTLFFTGEWPWGYAVTFQLGLLVLLWDDLLVCTCGALVTCAVANLGLRRSLTRFPWDVKWYREMKGTWLSRNSSESIDCGSLGWPFGKLAPKIPGHEFHIPWHQAFLIGLSVGWVFFVAASRIPAPEERRKFLSAIWAFVLLLGPSFRLIRYTIYHRPPISFLGRLATGRWIIPGYDRILVAPLLALAFGVALVPICFQVGLDSLLAYPMAIGTFLFICLGMGPSLETWRLTGNHRIVEGRQRPDAVKVG